jgi:hypothetical protein
MNEEHLDEVGDGEARVRARMRALVREQPWVALAASAALGGMFGGVVLSRIGRLAFAATAGFVAHELWHREGQLGVNDLVERLAGQRAARSAGK